MQELEPDYVGSAAAIHEAASEESRHAVLALVVVVEFGHTARQAQNSEKDFESCWRISQFLDVECVAAEYTCAMEEFAAGDRIRLVPRRDWDCKHQYFGHCFVAPIDYWAELQ